jgi:hypothetical protein
LKKNVYLSKEKHIIYKQEHLAPCSPVIINLVFGKNTAYLLRFQGAEAHILLKIGLFSSVEETHAFLKSKPCMLESGASLKFFPVIVVLISLKEYCTSIWAF